MKDNKKKQLRGINKDFKALFERRLNDQPTKTFSQKFLVKQSDNYKKLKFMKIVATILKTAKDRKLTVRKVKLGSHLKKVFENPNLPKILAEYVNDPKFMQKYKKEQVKYKSYLRARKQRLIKISAHKLDKSHKHSPPKKLAGSEQKFKFEPGFAGMPFPPFMMNGPHFHPPMNITINALPNPNPRTETDPLSIELEDLTQQKTDLAEIKHRISDGNGLKEAINNLKTAALQSAAGSFASTTRLLS